MIRTSIAAIALAAAALTMNAAELRAQTPPVLRVTGTGEVRAAADQAVADFAVETRAATAREAGTQNASAMERVIAALVRAGVPRDRIDTRDYNVFPEYDPRPRQEGGEPVIMGYRVSNTVSVTLYELDRVGGVIDAALAAGVNRVNGVRFGLRDPQRFRQRAIADAVRRARADAESMATALNVQLGAVREAQTGADVYAPPPQPMLMARMAGAEMADAATPITPGELVVRATVSVVYGITATISTAP
ncbi:MAG TPA: SIMPL domain-containing protein [Longimicrobium sp.]|jgi:hypothetical protein|uniref:SIMPL domain-containing protein n=1 Tax=Longimicrobium sp. TaxID=2029185 RepID=UPI002ED7AA67